MSEKTVVVALGHRALGTTLPEQKTATKLAAKVIADLVEEGTRVVISHSNGPQVGMIHTAMNEFGKAHPDYTFAPMSVCSAMSQGYIGYDLQNAIRAELISRGIYKPVSTVLTQVVIDPYDEAFAEPEKIIGRVLNAEEAEAEEEKGNFVTKVGEGQYRRILAAPKPQKIVEIETVKVLSAAEQIVIAAGIIAAGIYLLTQQKKKLKQKTETKDEHYWEPYRPYQQLTEKPVHTSDNSDKDTASEASSITDPENTESDPASSTK